MPRPVCSRCNVEMVSSRIGVPVVYYAIVVNQQPFEVYSGDEFRCLNCGATVVSQFGNKPIWIHFQKQEMPDLDGAVHIYEKDRNFSRLADGKWVFWDETGDESVPYETYAEAKEGRRLYGEMLNKEKSDAGTDSR
jgi:hypothetical protein